MTTPAPDPAQRVGDAERQAAIATLGDHWRAGRLDPAEHEARTTKAFGAVTRGDLDALFTDLPADPGPAPVSRVPPTSPVSPVSDAAPSPVSMAKTPARPTTSEGLVPAGSWVHRKRDAIMGVTPFAATGLFFLTHYWEWWLAIPAMGALLYAGDGGKSATHEARDAARAQERERRRLDRGH